VSVRNASTYVYVQNVFIDVYKINAADDWSVRNAFTDVTVINESKYVVVSNAAVSVRNISV
jgi:hypothetical protein